MALSSFLLLLFFPNYFYFNFFHFISSLPSQFDSLQIYKLNCPFPSSNHLLDLFEIQSFIDQVGNALRNFIKEFIIWKNHILLFSLSYLSFGIIFMMKKEKKGLIINKMKSNHHHHTLIFLFEEVLKITISNKK